MARPRGGDFCYSGSEFDVLRRDVDHALEGGADGVAFGILTGDGGIDVKRCRRVIRQIGRGGDVVFHRAFDRTAEPLEAIEQLVDLGVRRVMTSGSARTALAGAALIRELADRAAGRIEILPAGGIRPGNALRVARQTGCDQLHTSLRDRGGKMSVTALAEMVQVIRGVTR